MVTSRSSIPQQISKPGVKKKKKSLYSKAKDKIKKLDITKKMPESLKKNPIRKKLSKAARFGLKTATGSNLLGIGIHAGLMALDEYNKPENKLKRLKRQKKLREKRRTGTDRQRARHGSGVLTAAEERELDRKQKELEEVVNKYMGGSLNTTRRK
tara:strand:- start:1541 stop:2005 length:465 start_codon:yes stop_codon:yes gene_type:complete